ncbi:indole-3-glycerol phosphate synthase TrpC [Olivibacter sitiensis]|uniref:indole-3-glycerol phosphate synthase TrpC n=1 Tax=Olivibacter sitiensis TaxID=376470 RepID=UPI000401E75C|nr:indole-3-glycerol phosphate synthase TrpC [Olivibacter sitiensis]
MTILDKIIARKREEVAIAKKTVPLAHLERLPFFERSCYQLADFVRDEERTGIISEFKRASPSKGLINGTADVVEVVSGYDAAGASAISVLTDKDFFKGSLNDLVEARRAVNIPLLRKDFTIDEYQVAEAKAHGADIILLIAAAMSTDDLHRLAAYSKNLGLNVLLEVHSEEELHDCLFDEVDAIGVNNRNLKDFVVSVENAIRLAPQIPDRYIKVAESGISDPATIRQLKQVGFDAFLIGENFMKSNNPAQAIKDFVSQL